MQIRTMIITHRSTKSWSWQDPTVWSNGVIPSRGSRVVIDKNHDVEMSGTCEAWIYFNNNFVGGAVASTYTVTITNASPAVITSTTLLPSVGYVVRFYTTGTLPTGISPDTDYYILADGLTNTTFRISSTHGGAPIATSSAGSGTHTMTFQKIGNVTVTVGSTPTINFANHPFAIGDAIQFGGTTLPSGNDTSTYFVAARNFTANSFELKNSSFFDNVWDTSLTGSPYFDVSGVNVSVGLLGDNHGGIVIHGILRASRTVKTTLHLYGTIMISGSGSAAEPNKGNFLFGTKEEPISDLLGSEIIIHDTVIPSGRTNANGPIAMRAGFLGSGGKISVWSDANRDVSLRLDQTANIGDTVIYLEKPPRYQIGDTLFLEGDPTSLSQVTTQIGTVYETAVVQSISGNAVTLTAPLAKVHNKYRIVQNTNINTKIKPNNPLTDVVTIHTNYNPFYYKKDQFNMDIGGMLFENCFAPNYVYNATITSYYSSIRIEGVGAVDTIQNPSPYNTILFSVFNRHDTVIDGYALRPLFRSDLLNSNRRFNISGTAYGRIKNLSILYTQSGAIEQYYTLIGSLDIDSFHINNVNTIHNSTVITGTVRRFSSDGAGTYYNSSGSVANFINPIFFRTNYYITITNRDNGFNDVRFIEPISAYGLPLLFSVSIAGNPGFSNIYLSQVGGDNNFQESHSKQGYIKKDITVYKTSGKPSVLMNYNGVGGQELKFSQGIISVNETTTLVTVWLKKELSTTTGTMSLNLFGLGIDKTETIDIASELSHTEWRQFSIQALNQYGSDGIVSFTLGIISDVVNSKVYACELSNPTSAPYNTGDMTFFNYGEVAQVLTSNFTPASSIRDAMKADSNVPGSMGESLKNTEIYSRVASKNTTPL